MPMPRSLDNHAATNHVDCGVSQDSLRQRECFLIHINYADKAVELFEYLEKFCVFTSIGQCSSRHDEQVIAAVGFKRASEKVSIPYGNIGIADCICPSIVGLQSNTHHRRDRIFDFVKRWVAFQIESFKNLGVLMSVTQ